MGSSDAIRLTESGECLNIDKYIPSSPVSVIMSKQIVAKQTSIAVPVRSAPVDV